MAPLVLNLLGGFEMRSPAGAPVMLSARKPMALLAYLALHPGQPLARDRLATLLWQDRGDAHARSSLRQALAALRKALPVGDETGDRQLLISRADTVALEPRVIDTDVAAFERCIAAGSPADLERAVALYRGDLLDGINPRAPAFDDWLMMERQRLRERAVDAMSRLLDHACAAGSCEAGIRVAMRLLSLDPLQEPVHRKLMQLYARQGRHAVALKQYETCRAVLDRELGVAPEPETEALYRDILRQRRAPRPDPARSTCRRRPSTGRAARGR